MNEEKTKILSSKKAILAFRAAKVITIIYICQKTLQLAAIITDQWGICLDLSMMQMMSDETYVTSLGAIYALYNVGNMGEHAASAYKERSNG